MNQLETVIVQNIGELKLQRQAFHFVTETTVILRNVAGWHFIMTHLHTKNYFFTDTEVGLASFGANIKNLAIVDSSLLGLKPSNFDRTFSPQALVLLNSTVTAHPAVRYSVREGFLFQPKHPVYLLRVESCQIETSERIAFVKANAAVVNISCNILTLDGALSSSIEVIWELRECYSSYLRWWVRMSPSAQTW